jgi:4-amino-4-deoxy-L-arabinose transferase-like glycosyltransferase
VTSLLDRAATISTLRDPIAWCVAAALPLLLARASVVGLADPSEGRYAQICREMSDSGDWVVPTWLNVPHLEKPPLAYWSGALGIRLLGRSELPARLGAVVALVASAVLAAGIARRVAGPEASVPTALGVLVAPLPVVAGAACHTDPFLLAATTLFHHSVVRRLRDGSPRALDVAALALALGILAKGHMVLLFTVVPLACARTGVFRELWRPRRLLLLLALTAPWFAAIEMRFPGFFRHQAGALAGRATGSGHNAPFFIYVFALAAGLLPFATYAPRGFARLFVTGNGLKGLVAGGAADRRLLLFWLLVPLVVLSAAGSRLWTYILPAVPPVAILAGARLGSLAPVLRRWPAWALGACGAALVAASLAGVPKSAGPVLPFLSQLGIAALLGAAWLVATRRLPRGVATAGVSAVLVAGVVTGAFLHEDLFRVHRAFARDVAALSARTGGGVIVAGMSLPSLGFYCDAPVRIAGESGPLAREARAWGESPLFTPETDLRALLAEDRRSVIVLKEKLRLSLAPDRVPLIRAGELVAVCGGSVGPGR